MATIDHLERSEREALKAMDEIVRSAQKFTAAPQADAAHQGLGEATLDLPSINPSQLCQEYSRLKPTIELVLTFVARIPIYGSKVAAVIRFLMGIADTVCPVVHA